MQQSYILIDMNTQKDFLDEDGAVPVVNRAGVIRNLYKIFGLAKNYHVPVISAVDSHRQSEMARPGFSKHCIEGTSGQNKLPFTLFPKRIFVEANNNFDLPTNLLKSYHQVVFRRRTTDFLENPKADRLLSGLHPEQFIIFGVGLERSIRRLILCLLARGRSVGFIPEACGYWSETEADLSVRLLLAKGARQVAVQDLETLFKNGSQNRIRRIFSKPPTKPGQRRSLAG